MQINSIIKKIYISKSSLKDWVTEIILKEYSHEICEVIEDRQIPNHPTYNQKQVLWLTQSKGDIVKGCPGTDKSYLCCRYQVINHTMNCPLNCTYCILQYYLNQPAIVIYTNFDTIIEELKTKLRSQPNRLIRISTGELGDSLAFKGSRLFAAEVFKAFQEFPNVMFEIKSKLTIMDDLFSIPNNGNIVFSWSLNPQDIVDREESMADSISRRLQTAKQAQEMGFLTGFHFDPILCIEDWEKKYNQLIEEIYNTVEQDKIPWISMGSLRFPPSMKDKIIEHYPLTKIVYREMINGMDGKMRYVRPLRVKMYKFIYDKLSNTSNPPFIYFCMESPLVWQEVMGYSPNTNIHLDWMFADSIYNRFNILTRKPNMEYYDNALNLDGSEF